MRRLERWFKIQEPGDAKPFAVVFMGDDMLLRRFVPGEGLVDWPPMAMWIFGDEIGTVEITKEEAARLMKANVGKLPADLDTEDSRGTAPTLPVPV